MLHGLAPPSSRTTPKSRDETKFERTLEEVRKERLALRSGQPTADESTFERIAEAGERVMQMADARKHEPDVLGERTMFHKDRARQAQQCASSGCIATGMMLDRTFAAPDENCEGRLNESEE